MLTTKLYSDEELQYLREMTKTVTNPGAQWLRKPSAQPVHRQRSYKVIAEQNDNFVFEVYQRQSLADAQNYSCGIVCLPLGGSRLTLARYNGPSHRHGTISYRTHIHQATARAIAAGRSPEHDATETNRYKTLDGALACLIYDFNAAGIEVPPEQMGLF